MPTHFTDPRHLAAAQYRDATNLETRRALHERFSTNDYGWLPWVFDHLLPLPRTSAVLELGCGPGSLWQENTARVPSSWTITLTDYSRGMVAEARTRLDRAPATFTFAQADAQALPFGDAMFDAVIANHMLYHVPDRERAYREIARVLRPGGRFFAATNGANALTVLADRFAPDTAAGERETLGFTLEAGGAELQRWFVDVHREHYPDAFVITEAAPLVAYILSTTRVRERFAAEGEDMVRAEVHAAIARMLREHDAIHIPKAVGMFTARNR